MISFRGHAQQWRIFRMASASQMKWKSCTIALVINRNTAWFSKSQCFDRNTDGVNLWMNVWKICHKGVVTYPRTFFKWVYGNPWPLLVGIRRIPVYHVDYTTGPTSCLIVTLLFMFCSSDIFLFFIFHLSLSIIDLLISIMCTQIECFLLSIITRNAPLLLIGYKSVLGLGLTLWSKAFFKYSLVHLQVHIQYICPILKPI